MSIRTAADRGPAPSPGPRPSDQPGVAPEPGDAPVASAVAAGVGAAEVRAFVARAERVLRRHRPLLDRLDARLGDGDHGENMVVGFGHAARALDDGVHGVDDGAGEVLPGDLLRALGSLVVANVGGAGGSLYGTAFIEAGSAVGGTTTLSAADLARAFDAAAAAVARRGRCRVGDKTIYDALRPASDAFAASVAAGDDTARGIRAAADAARHGMRATTPMLARRGLALRLGERSRGHRDPGATSCFLLFRAMLGDGRAGAASDDRSEGGST